jgi:hypothetical protein
MHLHIRPASRQFQKQQYAGNTIYVRDFRQPVVWRPRREFWFVVALCAVCWGAFAASFVLLR